MRALTQRRGFCSGTPHASRVGPPVRARFYPPGPRSSAQRGHPGRRPGSAEGLGRAPSPSHPRRSLDWALTSLLLVLLLTATVPAASAGSVREEQVREIASELRCVVCQNLSVADSPSEMANQMRGIIRERLAAGESPEQVVAYFVDKYGEWILLSPRRQGFNLLVWTVPFLGLAAGLMAIAILTRRWSRRSLAATAEPVDPALRERIARELADLEP